MKKLTLALYSIKRKRTTLLVLTIVCICSLKNKLYAQTGGSGNQILQQKGSDPKSKTDTTYLDVNGKSYKYLGIIPDGLRTPEQKKLLKLINFVDYKYMSVKNNHMVFELTKEQYVAKGIPGRYYDLLQQNIKDNNHFFDANGIKNVDKMVKQTQEELASPEQKQK